MLYRFIEFIPMKESSKIKIFESIDVFEVALAKTTKNNNSLAKQLLLSLFIWAFFAIKSYFIAQALGVDIGFISIAMVTYITYMVAMIPLTPGGLGTFEGSMVLLLAPLGVAFHEGLLLALIIRFVTFWFVFLLSAIYLGIYQIIGFLQSKPIKTL